MMHYIDLLNVMLARLYLLVTSFDDAQMRT